MRRLLRHLMNCRANRIVARTWTGSRQGRLYSLVLRSLSPGPGLGAPSRRRRDIDQGTGHGLPLGIETHGDHTLLAAHRDAGPRAEAVQCLCHVIARVARWRVGSYGLIFVENMRRVAPA